MDNASNDTSRRQRTDHHQAESGLTQQGTGSLDLDGEFVSQVTTLVSQEPRTVTEVHQSLGEPQGLTRDQTEYRLEKLSASGSIQSKKAPGRTSPQIFWGGDTE